MLEMIYGVPSAKEKCCGCTACESICPHKAISMQADSEGFLYPVVEQNRCTNCGLCKNVCPLHMGRESMPLEGFPKVYAAKHRDDSVRKSSSSGGAFTAISDLVLHNGGVVYGCAYDENMRAIHIRADNTTERDRCHGSKYVQSDIRGIFAQVQRDLQQGKEVVFSGTPCQVAGLKTFLKREYAKLLTIDFACRGTPSPLLFHDHILMLSERKGCRVVGYNHRSKMVPWGCHLEVAEYADGTFDYKSDASQAYKYLFGSHLGIRPSCYSCGFSSPNRPADITIGDFWGIEKCIPSFKDSLGVSLLIFNTKQGYSIFDSFSNTLNTSEVTNMDYLQPSLQQPAERPKGRSEFWTYYQKNGYLATIKRYAYCSFAGHLKQFVKKRIQKTI